MAEKFFKCNVRKSGLTLGLVFALYHFTWSILIALFGTDYLKWIENLHFVSAESNAMAFDPFTLLVGVICAFILGGATGAVFAYIYNRI
jgi:hypothetical protein